MNALDAYLELFQGGSPAIDGECLDRVFSEKKAVELLSFTLQSQKDMSGLPPPPKKKSFDETKDENEKKKKPRKRNMTDEPETPAKQSQETFLFTITKEIDNATPNLFLEYCLRFAKQKVNFDKAKVTLRKAAGGSAHLEYLIYEFTNVWVKSWSLTVQGEDLPEEEVEFAFDTCKVYYSPQRAAGDGAVVKYAGWDFGNHKQL